MDKIKVGIVGLRHGMASVKEVLEDESYELVALCSRTRETYEYLCGGEITGNLDSVTFTEPQELLIRQCRAMKDFQQVDFYTDYDCFLDHREMAAVMIAVPIPLNAEYPIKALKKDKHVFAAKPFALTLKEGLELKKVVEHTATKFLVNYEFRYSTLMQNIHSQVASGSIGELRLMWWNMFRMPFRGAYAKRETSGGAFVAEVCHWFDLFHLFNSEIEFKKICAFGGLDILTGQQEIDDNAVCIIEYANSVRASINYTYFTDQPKHNLFGLVGDRGKIIADTDEAGRYVLYNGPEQNSTGFVVNPAQAHCGHLGFDASHRRFAEIIRRDLDVNKDEAKRGFESLLISVAAQMSSDQGRIITREEALAEAE